MGSIGRLTNFPLVKATEDPDFTKGPHVFKLVTLEYLISLQFSWHQKPVPSLSLFAFQYSLSLTMINGPVLFSEIGKKAKGKIISANLSLSLSLYIYIDFYQSTMLFPLIVLMHFAFGVITITRFSYEGLQPRSEIHRIHLQQ